MFGGGVGTPLQQFTTVRIGYPTNYKEIGRLTVDVGIPEFSVATFKPFGRVVTLVSGTLYSDYIK